MHFLEQVRMLCRYAIAVHSSGRKISEHGKKKRPLTPSFSCKVDENTETRSDENTERRSSANSDQVMIREDPAKAAGCSSTPSVKGDYLGDYLGD